MQGLAELVLAAGSRRVHGGGSVGRRTPNSVRKRLVLRRGSLDGCRRGQVRALEVGGGEVGDTMTNRSA